MNVFFEFRKIVKKLQREKIEYAIIGGVALAFYAEPRFTKDIDILTKTTNLEAISNILKGEGYYESSPPLVFKKPPFILHRFIKIENESEMVIDIFITNDKKLEKIIDNVERIVSKECGTVRISSKEDLIWLKKQRNSLQDKADIERLKDEKP